jgi:hypothetical protein
LHNRIAERKRSRFVIPRRHPWAEESVVPVFEGTGTQSSGQIANSAQPPVPVPFVA